MMKIIGSNRGFSLIELMVSLVIFSIVIGAIVSSRTTSETQYVTTIQASEMQQNARTGLLILKKDLRTAGFEMEFPKVGTGITAANLNDITFTRVDPASGALETITYSLNGGNLTRDINGGGNQAIAENIQTLNFTYLDGTGAGAVAADFSDIRYVEVSITSQVRAGHLNREQNTANQTRTITTNVYLRNAVF